jgi:hypothetical protein
MATVLPKKPDNPIFLLNAMQRTGSKLEVIRAWLLSTFCVDEPSVYEHIIAITNLEFWLTCHQTKLERSLETQER